MHFKSGGLYYMDRHGSRFDVDGAVELGDGLFFDATQPHDVDPIVPLDEGPQLGRMQMFAIPTLLEMPYENDRIIDEISVSCFIKGKLRLLKWILFARPDQKYGT